MSALALTAARRLAGGGLPALGPRADRLAKSFLPHTLDGEVAPGIRVELDTRDLTQRHSWWQGPRFETPTVAVLESWASKAERFFDVGANYGFYSYRLLSASERLEVHAFEPHPGMVAILEAAKERNDLGRLHVVPVALADIRTELVLHFGIEDQGHSTLGEHPDLAERGNGVRVEVFAFDEWRRSSGIPLPDHPAWVAKLDVEGFEERALLGMAEALAAGAFIGLAVELNDYTLEFCGTTAQRVEHAVRRHGYVRVEETADGDRWRTGDTWNAFFVPVPR